MEQRGQKVCYQHSHSYTMDFDTMDDTKIITDLIQAGTCHKIEDYLVVAIGKDFSHLITPIL